MVDQHDDLHAEQTEGFKVGEKKTLDEYQNLGEQLHLRPPKFNGGLSTTALLTLRDRQG